MTNEHIQTALTLHNQGITWGVIASYLNTTPQTLRKHIKLNDTTTKHTNTQQ